MIGVDILCFEEMWFEFSNWWESWYVLNFEIVVLWDEDFFFFWCLGCGVGYDVCGGYCLNVDRLYILNLDICVVGKVVVVDYCERVVLFFLRYMFYYLLM